MWIRRCRFRRMMFRLFMIAVLRSLVNWLLVNLSGRLLRMRLIVNGVSTRMRRTIRRRVLDRV